MKTVSFKVAKAIKEAGYPQGNLQGLHKVKSFPMYYKDDYIPDYEYFYLNYIDFIDGNLMTACPTYMQVWLWLWQEKKIWVTICEHGGGAIAAVRNKASLITFSKNVPEEAIIAAIEYLIDNDLIK